MVSKKIVVPLLMAVFPLLAMGGRKVFNRDFSPAAGLVTPQEEPYRGEICLNGLWELQLADVPADWKEGTGVAPELPMPDSCRWEAVKIKIPSPINVNGWGGGWKVGEGTDLPYAPSSVYFPSYPEKWVHARMGWMKRKFTVPAEWESDSRIILHFEAIAGECVVMINGKEAGRNFESTLPFTIDITDFVNRKGENEVMVGVRHPRLFDKRHPDYKYMGATYPTGSNTDGLLGIWQDVFLQSIPEVCITDVFVKPEVSEGKLLIDVSVANRSKRSAKVKLGGMVKEWINNAGKDIVTAPEINWSLGPMVMTLPSTKMITLKPGEETVITLRCDVKGELQFWSPDSPNLYMAIIDLIGGGKSDRKTQRFGWREMKIAGNEFQLNGEKIQCFGDIQHPFSAYVCSRRFAWAWYRMIKDFGGNAVRPHAQPWPRCYYDLADEMGLMVLDETGVFGSSIRMNFEEEETWQRSKEQLRRLIERDRNHPSVVGWSAGNETFAIALLNKPDSLTAARWDDKLVEMTLAIRDLDPTRDFITLDGDRDMNGRLPVWSKHFAHGLKLEDLPLDLGKPLIVGECGATYYGRPIQLYPFSGEDAFRNYSGRNDALAIDIYQNALKMAKPYLAYFSPSEVCWFGIEHLNLGYDDFSRLPDLRDGIFPGISYKEGKPGYQYERIPPYVTTFNPGFDEDLPVYKPLSMFNALKAGLAGEPWESFTDIQRPEPADLPEVLHTSAYIFGNAGDNLIKFVDRMGMTVSNNPRKTDLWIVDPETMTNADVKEVNKMLKKQKKHSITILALTCGDSLSSDFKEWLGGDIRLNDRMATALEPVDSCMMAQYFDLPALYFAETEGDRHIMKHGLEGELMAGAKPLLKASETDWNLFNNVAEQWKCAQVVLYEALEKPEGVAVAALPLGKNATVILSSIDLNIENDVADNMWHRLLGALSVECNPEAVKEKAKIQREINLLMDGPQD